jgi:hypothetical protein
LLIELAVEVILLMVPAVEFVELGWEAVRVAPFEL